MSYIPPITYVTSQHVARTAWTTLGLYDLTLEFFGKDPATWTTIFEPVNAPLDCLPVKWDASFLLGAHVIHRQLGFIGSVAMRWTASADSAECVVTAETRMLHRILIASGLRCPKRDGKSICPYTGFIQIFLLPREKVLSAKRHLLALQGKIGDIAESRHTFFRLPERVGVQTFCVRCTTETDAVEFTTGGGICDITEREVYWLACDYLYAKDGEMQSPQSLWLDNVFEGLARMGAVPIDLEDEHR